MPRTSSQHNLTVPQIIAHVLESKIERTQIAPSSSSILLNSANQFTNASGYQHQEPHGVLFLGISHHRPKRTWASIIGSSGSRSVPSSILAWQSQAQCLKFRGRSVVKLANYHQAQSQSGRHLSKNTGEAAFLGCHHGTFHATGNIFCTLTSARLDRFCPAPAKGIIFCTRFQLSPPTDFL